MNLLLKPPRPRILPSRISYMVFLLASLACITTYAWGWAKPDGHSGIKYLVVLHGIVLPAALVCLRVHGSREAGSRSDSRWTELRIPPIHILAVLGLAIATVLIGKSLENGRLISDESAYRFQARLFADGKLKADPMPRAAADTKTPVELYFEQQIHSPTGWFSKYPPGWPLVLAVGYLAHLPWLLNPIFGLLQCQLIWILARPFGRDTQIVAIIMCALSTYFLMWSVGFMAHGLDAVLCLLALGSTLRATRSKRVGPIITSMLLIVAATTVRPFTAAVLGIYCTAIAVYSFRSQPRDQMRVLLVMIVGACIAGGMFLLINQLFTGDPLLSPYALERGSRNIQEITLNAAEIFQNVRTTWRWAIADTVRSTFPFMFLLAVYGLIRERMNRSVAVGLALFFPTLAVAYCVQSGGSGSFNGERFYFEGFAALAIISARGFCLLMREWNVDRRSVVKILAILSSLQILVTVFGVREILSTNHPYAKMYKYAHSLPPVPMAFLKDDSPQFTAKHVNWNQADWKHAETIYLIDPGPARRDEVACRFGRPHWRVITYDAQTDSVSAADATARCNMQQERRPSGPREN